MLGKADLIWTRAGPVSRQTGDVYYSAEGGLAEARDVFLRACGFPEAFANQALTHVVEVGFGTGLNILALWHMWRAHRPAGHRLHVTSFEAYPMARNDAARAHADFYTLDPEIETLSRLILAQWPPQADGRHHLAWPEEGVSLDVLHQDVVPGLTFLTGAVDAWFLDGFAPQKGPEAWREDIYKEMARLSAPGAPVGTFTVAGAVRRGLAAAGFTVTKVPGFGRKRERLEARWPGPLASRPAGAKSVAVVGAGIAGACLAAQLHGAGHNVTVFEADTPASGASGNPVGLVSPRLDRGEGALPQSYAQAWRYATGFYNRHCPQAISGRGLLKLARSDKDGDRFHGLLQHWRYADEEISVLTAQEASARAQTPIAMSALWLPECLHLKPVEAIALLLRDVPRVKAQVTGWQRSGANWQVTTTAETHGPFDVICLANGVDLGKLTDLEIMPSLGQVSVARPENPLPVALSWGGYVVPLGTDVVFGATHEAEFKTVAVTPQGHTHNQHTLAEALPALASELSEPHTGRAGVRATTRHRLPICGPLADGIYVLGGLGSRGLTFAPILAAQIAAEISGCPQPLSSEGVRHLHPTRFARAHCPD